MMNETSNKLKELLTNGMTYLAQATEMELSLKETPEKWSKKEILGHLIDSAINNLQRFTEIQFEEKPYKIRKYNQDALVLANNYQMANTKELLDLWFSINIRIQRIIEAQTTKTLGYPIEVDGGKITDLKFLIEDYVVHLEHHLIQIIHKS